MRRAAFFVITGFVFAVHFAGAQTAPERAALVAWDDSIARLPDPAALDRFASRARQATNGANDLRVALVQMRRASLTHDRQLNELALIRLDAVAHSHPDWPWPELLLARAFYAANDSDVEYKLSAGVMEGEPYVDAAMRHLAGALKLDPAVGRTRRLALDVLVPEGDRELREAERAMLRALLGRRDPEADAMLVAARDYRTKLRYDSALTMLDRALARGGDRSRLQLERARTLQALGDTAGASRAYWAGVDGMTPTGREMYHHDLAWILAPDSLALFDRLPADSVGNWLRDFWTRRDAEAANRPGERLIEHLRRWNFAFAHFRVDRPWRLNEFKQVEYGFEGLDLCIGSDAELYDLLNREQPTHANDARHREPLLDHRGLIYLHHGRPYRVVYRPRTAPEPPGFALTDPPPSPLVAQFDDGKLPSPQLSCIVDSKDPMVAPDGPNESWLYWFDGRWRVMNFRGSCTLGVLAPTTLTSYLPVDGSKASAAAWAARADLTPDYAAAAMDLLYRKGSLPPSCMDHVTPMIRISRADADVATRTDSHTPFVPHPWNALIQAFALGAGADNSGEALVTLAIPFDSLHSTRHPDGSRTYDVAARIVGYDHLTGNTFAVDTLRQFAAPREAVGSKGHLAGWFEFALDPGDWQIAVRMQQPGDSLGAYSLLPHVKIDAKARLMLSDLVTGANNGANWTAPDGAAFPVNVLGAWSAGGAAELYYEVRGLRPGEQYHTAVTVNDVAGKPSDALHIESTDRATGTTSAVRKTLGLAQLKAGTYHVTVTVSRGTDTATRTHDLLITKPEH
jgi:tetratricopeptide (TPR) repeat protein